MKLLLDENLSDRVVGWLRDIYPDSAHVKQYGLTRSSDEAIWTYAQENGFVLVSKDWDFHQRSLMHGAPPKLIFLRVGNCRPQYRSPFAFSFRADLGVRG